MDEQMSQQLQTLAARLYGSDADLKFVVGMIGRTGREEDEIRGLLRTEYGLVQDPISGTWFQLVARPLRNGDLKEEAPPTDQSVSSP